MVLVIFVIALAAVTAVIVAGLARDSRYDPRNPRDVERMTRRRETFRREEESHWLAQMARHLRQK